jgi:Zn-finger nucleic acid-binding protein
MLPQDFPNARFREMICPACKSPMLVIEHDGIELDHCPRCEGTWFDRDELALLMTDGTSLASAALQFEAIAAQPDADVKEAPRRCPRCGKKMRKVNIGPGDRVLVDVCARGHGLYFDRGEVADLARNLQLEGEDLPARALNYLGRTIRRGDAAPETEAR